MRGVFKRRAGSGPHGEELASELRSLGRESGAENQNRQLSGLGGTGFEPPRRPAAPPSRNDPPNTEASDSGSRAPREESARPLDRAGAEALQEAIGEVQRLHHRVERTEASTRALAEAERRLEDAERCAAAASERRLIAALEEQREELEAEARRQVEEARNEAQRDGDTFLRARERELGLEFAAIETKLASAREQLSLAEDRIASLERRRFRPGSAPNRHDLEDELEHPFLRTVPPLPS